MTENRDPLLQQLFDDASRELDAEVFVSDVMKRIDTARRGTIMIWIVTGLVLLPVGWVLVALMQDVFQLMSQILPSALVEVQSERAQQLLSPVNTVSAAVALVILLLYKAWKFVFSK